MELWIRSQDKESLIQVDCLCIEKNEIDKGKYIYSSFDIVQGCITLGTYKTKERALEVLGEIDERIMLLNTLSIAKDRDTLLALKNALPEEKLQGLAYPYEMPKE